MAVVLHSLVAMVPLVLHGCGGDDDHGGATTTIPDGDKTTTTTTTSTVFWCPGDKEAELAQPDGPFDHNGKSLKTICHNKREAHFFGIGDWGGDSKGHTWSNAGAHRKRQEPADSQAGAFVARQMNARAAKVDPDVVLNAGDNFYPSGLNHRCGGDDVKTNTDPTKQFFDFLETPFNGENMKGKPWLSVLGNHDYGGISHFQGWDYQIQHTWATGSPDLSPDGWRLPAQYWHQQVKYHGFAVDFFMLDSNTYDASPDPQHGLCRGGSDCYGLTDDKCPGFFTKLWNDGVDWLETKLKNSTAEYKIVVTHFPNNYFVNTPKVHEKLAKIHSEHGIDLFFTGHTHLQQFGMDEKIGVPYIISGGGGGITSEGRPSTDGNDDQYGFVDFTVNATNLKIEFFSWGGPDGENVKPRKTIILTQGNYSSPSKDLTV